MRLKTRFEYQIRRFAAALAVVFASFVPAALSAATLPGGGVALEWNANLEPDVAGYKVYLGSVSGQYPSVTDVGNTTKLNLPQLDLGSTVYMAVSAYNSVGVEGARSAEFVLVVDAPAPAASTSFAMSAPSQGKVSWKYPKSAAVPAADHFRVYASEDLINWSPAGEVPASQPSSSDANWLYFDFPYVPNKPRMFFQVGAANLFGETR